MWRIFINLNSIKVRNGRNKCPNANEGKVIIWSMQIWIKIAQKTYKKNSGISYGI